MDVGWFAGDHRIATADSTRLYTLVYTIVSVDNSVEKPLKSVDCIHLCTQIC